MKKVAEVLVDAKAKISELIPDSQDILRLNFVSTLDTMINRANFLGGNDLNFAAPVDYPPIKRIGNKEVVRPATVKEGDLEPGEEEKQKFLEKVDTLLKDLPGLENKKILESYTTKEDILVIRGAAKKVKVQDYATAPVDNTFLENIRKAALALSAAKAFEEGENAKVK